MVVEEPRPRKERSFGPVQAGTAGGGEGRVVGRVGWLLGRELGGGGGLEDGEDGLGGVLNEASHSFIRDQARSLTALWIGIMVGMVEARSSSGEDGFLDFVLLETGRVEGRGGTGSGGSNASGECFRSTAWKNCASLG